MYDFNELMRMLKLSDVTTGRPYFVPKRKKVKRSHKRGKK